MTADQLLRTNLKLFLAYQIEKSRAELRAQGHYASGRLDKSFESKVVGDARGVVLGQILAEQYGEALDTGVKAANIRYNPRVLLPWLRDIGKTGTDSELLSIAYKIQAAHKREGMPTRNAMSYSSNGRRTGWKEESIKAANDRFEEVLGLDDVTEQLILEAFESFGK